MSPTSPRVSVILPTFNRAKLLPEAIESIRQQTYPNVETIVVDDGSTDGTRSYLASLTDPMIQVILQDHGGNIAAARNKGIKMSTGVFVAFLDSDDVLMKRSLETLVKELLSNTDKDWSYGRHQLMHSNGHDISVEPDWLPELPSGFILREILADRAAPTIGAVMIRQTLIAKTGMFDETLPLAEDFDLWLRLAISAPAVAIDAKLVRVRQHDDRTTSKLRDMARCKAMVFAKLKTVVTDKDVRRTCTRLYGEQLIKHASVISKRDTPWKALQVLAQAAPTRGATLAWWRELAKILVRPVIQRATSKT